MVKDGSFSRFDHGSLLKLHMPYDAKDFGAGLYNVMVTLGQDGGSWLSVLRDLVRYLRAEHRLVGIERTLYRYAVSGEADRGGKRIAAHRCSLTK